MKIPENVMKGIELIENENERMIQFLFSGNMNELVSTLSGYQLENLIIEEPSLEDIFLHYYKDGGND